MSDPAIRAALEAAEKAWWTVPAPAPGLRRNAAAIAAFLRQMDGVPLGNGFTFAALAAALEEAARDA